MSERVPTDAQDLITKHIHSVAQLEVLLDLRRAGDDPVTVESVAHKHKVGGDMARDLLADLEGRGFLRETEAGFTYSPSGSLARQVDALANAYQSYRVSIINLIFSKPSEGVQSFADAFRLRKDED